MAVGMASVPDSSLLLRDRNPGGFWQELASGLPLNRELALTLLRCADDELPFLLAAAWQAKERFRPGVITYSRKIFVPLTNLCRNHCGYCMFRRDPANPGAHTMTPDEVLALAVEGEKLGCHEALFTLGDKPEAAFPEMRTELRRLGYGSTLDYLEAMCALVLCKTALLPHANPGVVDAAWLARLGSVCASLGLMVETASEALLAPGAAHERAPDKVPARRLRVVEEAGKLGIPFTTGLLIGIGETAQDRVETLFAIGELHRRYGHIQEVIVQNFRSKPTIPMRDWPEPSRGDMLRTVAVARLVLGEMNIQAPPNLFAPDYEELLQAGINDWGGVSPLTPDFVNPEAPWPHLAELKCRTETAGQQLRDRLCVYPEYARSVAEKPGWLGERVREAAEAIGYAGAV